MSKHDNLFAYTHRLYTGPKDDYVFNVLSSPAYKIVMANNIDLEHSFNDYDISIDRTLKEAKKALFTHSYSSANSDCRVNFDYAASPCAMSNTIYISKKNLCCSKYVLIKSDYNELE